MITSYYVHAFV